MYVLRKVPCIQRSKCFAGGYATLLPVVLSDMFGIAIIGKSFGWNRFAMGIAGLISPPIGGKYTSLYKHVFFTQRLNNWLNSPPRIYVDRD